MSKYITFTPGRSSSGKHKKMPGTQPYKSQEIKRCSMLTATTAATNIFDLFTFTNMYTQYHDTSAHKIGSWLPIPVVTPSNGVNEYQIIGNAYKLKYFRLKGMVVTYGNVFQPVNWRLRLIRTYDDLPFSTPTSSSGLITAVNTYIRYMYKNPFPVAGTDSLPTLAEKIAKTYYMSIKNQLAEANVKSKVIASGFIPANQLPKNFDYQQFGSSTGFVTGRITGSLKHEQYSFSKFDVRVLVNDVIRYEFHNSPSGSGSTIDTKYWLVLETDQPVGWVISDTSSQGIASYYRSDTKESNVFEIQMSQIQYFTDS